VPFAKYLAQDFDLMPYTTVAEENVGRIFCGFKALKKLAIDIRNGRNDRDLQMCKQSFLVEVSNSA
jgi:hypothetical protein